MSQENCSAAPSYYNKIEKNRIPKEHPKQQSCKNATGTV
jgi:hypothetical protein